VGNTKLQSKSVSNFNKDNKLKLKQNQSQSQREIKSGNSFLSFLKNLVFGDSETPQDSHLNTNYDTLDFEESSEASKQVPSLKTKDLKDINTKFSNVAFDNQPEEPYSPIRTDESQPKFVYSQLSNKDKPLPLKSPIPKKQTTSTSFNRDDDRKSDNKSSSSTTLQAQSPIIPKNNLLFAPCMNCNNMILLEEVENHSNNCIVIKEEVNKIEASKYAYHVVDYKLKKILEHIQTLQIPDDKYNDKNLVGTQSHQRLSSIPKDPKLAAELSKETHIFHILETTVKDAISVAKISNSSLSTLKKFLINLDSITHSFKGTWTTSILIDRCRILLHEKMNILRKSLKELNENRKTTAGRKSNVDSVEKLKENLIKEKEEKEKLNEFLENEKEMIIRKTAVLKESTKNLSQISNLESVSTRDLDIKPSLSQETKLSKSERNEDISKVKAHKVIKSNQKANYTSYDEEEKKCKGIVKAPKPKYSLDSYKENSSDLKKSQEKSLNNSRDHGYIDNHNLDTEEDKVKDFMNIDSNTVNVNRNILKEITSDVESKNIDELSDNTSMTSNTSFRSIKEIPSIPEKRPHDYIVDAKKLYQDFVKVVLKVKFEKIHNTHKGQDVPEKILFKECIKRNIPESEWSEFIQNELKYPEKYSEYFKSNNKKMRVLKNQAVFLDTIKEENL